MNTMSSAICQNFVQNAWKKELCSNCFKSKDEHTEQPKPKPVNLISNEFVEGIIKNSNKFKEKRTVCFTKDLTEIIGYGGEDWESDEENAVRNDSESSEEDIIESEDEEREKELKKLTKENTDFNTVNLKFEGVKKNHLLLGRPLVDSNGRKQTLMVSVTPFGEDTPTSKRFIRNISNIPLSKNNKETITDTRTNVVLTSYTKNEEDCNNKEEKSLLDEITETLENSKNPIQIVTRKKIQKDIVLTNNKNSKKDEDQEYKKIDTSNKPKGQERKIGLSRAPALKRDQEKPMVYQTSVAKIELSNTKKHNKENTCNEEKNEISDNKKTEETMNETIAFQWKNKDQLLSPNKVTNKDTISENDHPDSLPPQSREQAGEPDGRADPETVSEPPALPLTPPPFLETQSSFLHNSSPPEKPKVPSKPTTVLIRKSVAPSHGIDIKNQIMTTFSHSEKGSDELKTKLLKHDSNGSDVASKVNKRRAPKPPEEINTQENERRERASSCSPKIRDSIEVNQVSLSKVLMPEPAPRKMLSISTDNLSNCDDKRKENKTKGRFSLKKFLRMGSSKDLPKVASDASKDDDRSDLPPLPKPRLVIVHPSELNGAAVEVVSKPVSEDQADYQNIIVPRYSDCNIQKTAKKEYEHIVSKSPKPPPPPRNLDNVKEGQKPTLPHPPKSVEILTKQKHYTSNANPVKPTETVYANIGEVRSAIVPNKPQRTASMREREAQEQKQQHRTNSNSYEPINLSANRIENLYDYINNGRSSSPDSDSSPNKNSPTCKKTAKLNKRSESNIDVSGEDFKFSNIPRSLSLTYCGSETESEIYSPYSIYGSESEVTEDDHDWTQNGPTHKLRSRRGRSIVHKNLEDNYGAVVVANHEALAQVLENIQQTTHVPSALRSLKLLPNLRWIDFSLKSSFQVVTVGQRTFHQALWGTQHVTLIVSSGAVTSSTLSLGIFSLNPVIEFSDLIPSEFVNPSNNQKDSLVQATVSVLPWLQVNTIQSYSECLILKESQTHEDVWKDICFIMLQLVNALKVLQAQGIEELSLTLKSFVLCKEVEKDSHHRLCVLQGLGEELNSKENCEELGTLCMCASKALTLLKPVSKISGLIQSLLNNERAVTLTQVKSILEFCLWGPSDVALGSTIRERELALQRWLDLQRATVLHGLVCTRVQLTVYEECHLLFLVRSNSRMMCDASLLLESNTVKHAMSNGHI